MDIPNLSRVLAGVPWAAVGAIAARSYMPERTTADLDIAILPRDSSKVARLFKKSGFKFTGALSIGGSSWLTPEQFPVDVIEVYQPWAEPALRDAKKNVQPPGIPVLPMPYLALMKFEAGRLQDITDVSRMLGQADEEMRGAVRRLFAQYLPEELEDLQSLIVQGDLEINPPSTDDGLRE